MDPYAPRRRRRGRWIALAVVVALAAALAYAEHGGGSAGTSANVGSTVDAKVERAAAAKLKADCTEVNLLTCLEKEPRGAEPVLLPWGDSGDVTVQQYADTYYDTSPTDEAIAAKNLQDAGVRSLVHEKWQIPGQQEATADVVVMSFASAQGAQSRALGGEGGVLSAEGSDGLEVAIPGLPGYAYPRRAPNGDGQVEAVYFAPVGNLLMIVRFWSLASFDPADFASWTLGEYLTLRTARIPAAPVTEISAATTACSPLTACLISAPSGSTRPFGSWAQISAPGEQGFVEQMYPSSVTRATAGLDAQGLTDIAHTEWADSAGNEVDVILLRFKTLQGAESRTREEVAAGGGLTFGVSGPGSAEGTYSTTRDAMTSNYPVTVFGYVGDVAVEAHTFMAREKDTSEATSVAQSQFAKLAAVTTTSTAPQPALVVPSSAPSTLGGTSSCADALSCLVPLPSGASALSSSTTYNDSAQVTVAQFVADKYSNQSSGYQSYETGLLTSSGAKEVVHRGWFGPDGDQADVAVLVFGDAAQARSDAMDYQGAVTGSGRLFSVAGFPSAIGSAGTAIDNLGNVHTEIVGYTANFEVRMDYYSLGGFGADSAKDAIAWFDAQMAELPPS